MVAVALLAVVWLAMTCDAVSLPQSADCNQDQLSHCHPTTLLCSTSLLTRVAVSYRTLAAGPRHAHVLLPVPVLGHPAVPYDNVLPPALDPAIQCPYSLVIPTMRAGIQMAMMFSEGASQAAGGPGGKLKVKAARRQEL